MLDELDNRALAKGKKIPEAIRASVDGGQPQSTSMEKWLKPYLDAKEEIVGGNANCAIYDLESVRKSYGGVMDAFYSITGTLQQFSTVFWTSCFESVMFGEKSVFGPP